VLQLMLSIHAVALLELESFSAIQSLSGIGVSVRRRGLHAGVTTRGQRYVSAGLPGTGLSVRQYSPVNSAPKLSFWPLAIAAAILASLLAVAARLRLRPTRHPSRNAPPKRF
jgi:hypothetical protein